MISMLGTPTQNAVRTLQYIARKEQKLVTGETAENGNYSLIIGTGHLEPDQRWLSGPFSQTLESAAQILGTPTSVPESKPAVEGSWLDRWATDERNFEFIIGGLHASFYLYTGNGHGLSAKGSDAAELYQKVTSRGPNTKVFAEKVAAVARLRDGIYQIRFS